MDRFDGISEDEVTKRTLPDHLGPNLDIVIVSIRGRDVPHTLIPDTLIP